MEDTTNQDGIEFRLSKKTGLHLPSRLQERVDHPIKTALKRAIKLTLMAATTTAALLACISPTFADDKDQNHLFAGSIWSGSQPTIDNIVDYRNKNGTKLIVEGITSPWADNSNDQLNLALQVPLPFLQQVKIGSYLDLDLGPGEWANTSILEVKAMTDLVVRAGSIFDSQGTGGAFFGAKFSNPVVAVDGDMFYGGKETQGIQTYVSAMLPLTDSVGSLYISLGGRAGKVAGKEMGKVNTLTGLINPGGLGIFNYAGFDITNNTQSGKVIVVPKGSTYKKSSFDFRMGHVFTGTGMINTVTGYTPISWPPFDAHAVDGKTNHVVLSGDWNNSEKVAGGSLELLYRANPEIFFGVGPAYSHDKVEGEHNPRLIAEIAAMIPKTPIETWAKVDANLRTGKVTPTFYAGVIGKF